MPRSDSAAADPDPQLGHVALEERPHELTPPNEAARKSAQNSWREAAAQPQTSCLAHPDLSQKEARERHNLDPAGQRLRGLTLQAGRGTAEDEESRRQGPAVDQHPQNGKEIGPPLDLIDHDDPPEAREGGHRFPGGSG
jgi:hypothetical protein